MGPFLIALSPVVIDYTLSGGNRDKSLLVKTLCSQGAVEGLAETVSEWLAMLDEYHPHPAG